MVVTSLRMMRHLACLAVLSMLLAAPAVAQSPASPATPDAKTAPAVTPKTPAPATPSVQAPAAAPPTGAPSPAGSTASPKVEPPVGKPENTEIEPNGSPGIPDNATTESVSVPSRVIALVSGKSSYDDAFKSIKTSIGVVKAALDKAGLKPGGHPVTIFSEPDDKGFKYKAGIPLAARPPSADLGAAALDQTPAGKAIKFQHRGAYEDIDSTYDVITAYLDAKGLQASNPYIEEYLTDLTTPDDPNLQVDIYVFVK